MSNRIELPTFVDLHPDLSVPGPSFRIIEVSNCTTVGECIGQVEKIFPGITNKLCDDTGQIHSYFDVYIDGTVAQGDRLKNPVKDGDTLTIAVVAMDG